MSNLNFSSCNCHIQMGVENIVFSFKQACTYFVLLTLFLFIFSIPVLLASSYRFPRPLTNSFTLPWALSPSGFFPKCKACTDLCYPAVASLVPSRAWQYHIRLYPDIYTPGWRVFFYNSIALLTHIHLVIQCNHRPFSAELLPGHCSSSRLREFFMSY